MAVSIAAFRHRLQAVFSSERVPRRHVIALGIDGIRYDLACLAWRRARVTRAQSVFPTTSATAWLTALTGSSVEEHGIPGVVFACPDEPGSLIDVYTYRGTLGTGPNHNVFTDAARAGYAPIAILGELQHTVCTWRDLLLHHAHSIDGDALFANLDSPLAPAALGERLAATIEQVLANRDVPCFVWCFIDTDRYIHRNGYDDVLINFLERVDEIAAGWAHRAVVLAHSDHGLVTTRHDPIVANVFERVIAEHKCRMGGAGRTRWLYVDAIAEPQVRDELARGLPASVCVHHADEVFAPGSLARQRVGSIVVEARGDSFIAADGDRFEHGSSTPLELDVPIAEWRC